MIDKDLVFLNFQAKDSNDFFDNISKILYERGYVKDSFKEAIKNREKNFPTGLPIEPVGVAIPHTDSCHINKPKVVFVRFNKNIEFKEMGGDNNVAVGMAFVLLVTDKEKQVPLLQKLMGLFTDQDLINKLYKKDKEEIINILEEELK